MSYHPPAHLTQNWSVTKPSASSRRGMVVSQSRDAALAGVAILDAGGNAVDAAVGTALALAAVEPWNSGLGGIGFAVVHRAGQKAAETIDFGPVAPAALKPDLFRLTGRMKQDLFAWPEVEHDANIHGPLSFVIPSAVAGYAHMHGRFGTLPLGEVMAPAIALARRGLSQDWFTTLKIANSASVLRLYPSSAELYLPNGLPPVAPYQGVPGFLRLTALADTLERLSHAGLRDFYEGDIAASLVADIAALGGLIGADDLRHCEARIVPVEEYALEGRVLQVAAGLTAGPTLIRVLSAMRDVHRGPAPDATWFAALARAMKAAYAERLTKGGESSPVENEPREAESCTTHLTVCDEAGTMVAMTTTLLSSMGSRLVLPGSGVLMNNGVMWFDPRPGQPNSAAPGKRPLTNMCPVIVREGDAPVLALGSSGGRRIMASVAQMLAFTGDFGMEPEAAAHHPRIDVSDPGSVNADERLAPDVLDALRADGVVSVVEHGVLPVNFACPNLIVQRGGQRTGISDVMSPWSAAIAQS
jgi:gamma-glutamyltranspeptidase / glutathione hydrolase